MSVFPAFTSKQPEVTVSHTRVNSTSENVSPRQDFRGGNMASWRPHGGGPGGVMKHTVEPTRCWWRGLWDLHTSLPLSVLISPA